MTSEEIEELKGLAASMGLYDDKKPCKRAVILGKAIKALEQDTVSKESYDHEYFLRRKMETQIDHLHKYISKLETQITEQEPKKGHWIDKFSLIASCSAECSACHERSSGYVYDTGYSLKHMYYDFCPKCGADMRGVKK